MCAISYIAEKVIASVEGLSLVLQALLDSLASQSRLRRTPNSAAP